MALSVVEAPSALEEVLVVAPEAEAAPELDAELLAASVDEELVAMLLAASVVELVSIEVEVVAEGVAAFIVALLEAAS